jgi:hypothetical protein
VQCAESSLRTAESMHEECVCVCILQVLGLSQANLKFFKGHEVGGMVTVYKGITSKLVRNPLSDPNDLSGSTP